MAIYKGDKKIDASAIEMPISTSITSSSTNDEVAGAKAVYDLTVGMTTRNVLTAISMGTTLVTSNTYTLIPLVLFASQGSKLTVNSNGEIVIGDNVSQILISGKCVFKANTTSIKYFAIYQNNTKVFTAYKSIANNNADELACPSYVMNVNSGDTIALYAYGSANDNINGSAYATEPVTYLTAEVISADTQTRTLNLAKTTNTGSLVGMGDRAELTSLATEVTDNNVGEQEIKEVTPLETTEEKTEGSGDIL